MCKGWCDVAGRAKYDEFALSGFSGRGCCGVWCGVVCSDQNLPPAANTHALRGGAVSFTLRLSCPGLQPSLALLHQHVTTFWPLYFLVAVLVPGGVVHPLVCHWQACVWCQLQRRPAIGKGGLRRLQA